VHLPASDGNGPPPVLVRCIADVLVLTIVRDELGRFTVAIPEVRWMR